MPVDDPKLDPVWEMCAKYNRPVMIHSADPAAFFTPLDRFNERWHELNEHPNWLFHGERFPSRDEILMQRNRVIARHPKTTFICAHFANNPEDLAAVGSWLDSYPNMYVDVDARISELGRQPYTTRKFLLKYQDRIMFGTDTAPDRDAYRMYFRFLETDDEYFDCASGHHRQGFWMIYGLFLPDDVLKKIYHENAERIFFARQAGQEEPASAVMRIRQTEDFTINGRGDASAWKQAAWEPLHLRVTDGHQYRTRVKMLYSRTGLYILMEAEDRTITAKMKEDFLDLWNEDVFEFFLWPDERYPVYFEYEISPLGYELPILIPNFGGEFLGWRPWHYEGERKTQKGHYGRGRPETVRCPHNGLESRSVCSVRPAQALAKRSPAARKRGGEPISIALITMTARARAGTGPGSEEVFTSLTSSARSFSSRAAITASRTAVPRWNPRGKSRPGR